MSENNPNQQQRNESPQERVNDIVNHAKQVKNLKKNAQKAQKGAKLAKQGAKTAGQLGKKVAIQTARAATTTIVDTAPVWGPVALIILAILGVIFLIIVLAIVIITIFFGGGGQPTIITGTQQDCVADLGGQCLPPGSFCTSPNTIDTGGTCKTPVGATCCVPPITTGACGVAPTCASGDYLFCLKNQFGITMQGAYNTTSLKVVYDGFAIGFKYPTFLAWFKSVTPTVTISSYAQCPNGQWCAGAWATVTSGAQMTLYQNFINAGARYQRYILTHEAGHMAAQANRTANNAQYVLYQNAYAGSQSTSCYNNIGIIDTYPWHVVGSGQLDYDRKVRESWAESVADSVLCPANTTCPSNGGGGTSISNFPGTCSYIYNYVNKTLGC